MSGPEDRIAELERRLDALEAGLIAAYTLAGRPDPFRQAGRETAAQGRRQRIERSGLSMVTGGDAS